MVGFNDLKGFLQPKRFYNSIYKIEKQKLLNLHVKWKKWVWLDPISLWTILVITKAGGQVEHTTDRGVDMCHPMGLCTSTIQTGGLWLGDLVTELLAWKLQLFVWKAAMAPHAGVCTIANSPRKIQDLFPLLSGREESILSNEIAYDLKKSYHLNTKGGGFFFAFFFFSSFSKQNSNWQAWQL